MNMAGTSQYLQQDFISYREYTNEKLQQIDEKMDLFMEGMNALLRQKNSDDGERFENPFGGNDRGKRPIHIEHSGDRGFFKNPKHAEQERNRRYEEDEPQWKRRNNTGNDEEEERELKHLKIVFPTFTEVDDAKSWIQDCDEANCDGSPIYDDYVEASDYDCLPTYDQPPQYERNCVFDDKAEFINNIRQGTTQPEYEEEFCYNEVPVIVNIIEVEQGFKKKKGVLTFVEQQQEASLVRELSWQPHMMQLKLESEDQNTNITAPNGSKPFELFDKIGCSQGVVCHPIQFEKEWFASLEPWRDKVEMSSQNIQLEKVKTTNFSPYAYPKYVEKATSLFLQPYDHSKSTASFVNQPSLFLNKHDNQSQFLIESSTFSNNLKIDSYLSYKNASDQRFSRIVKGICYNEFSIDFLEKYMESIGNISKEAMMNKSTCFFPNIVLVSDYTESPLVQKLLQNITNAKKFYKSNDYDEVVQVEVLTGKNKEKMFLNQKILPLVDFRRYSLFKWKMKENKNSLKTCVVIPLMQHFYLVMFSLENSRNVHLCSKTQYLVSTYWRYLSKNSKIGQYGVKVAWKNLKEKNTWSTWRLSPAESSSSRSK